MYVGWSWRRNERMKSKIMQKNTWFQPGNDQEKENQPSGRKRGQERMDDQNVKVESVILFPVQEEEC